MADSISLTAKSRLKTNRIHANSMTIVRDRKTIKIFIAHSKGVHIYDAQSHKFEDVGVE
jgi:hypothetical protein